MTSEERGRRAMAARWDRRGVMDFAWLLMAARPLATSGSEGRRRYHSRWRTRRIVARAGRRGPRIVDGAWALVLRAARKGREGEAIEGSGAGASCGAISAVLT